MISGIDYIMQLEQECDKQREYVKEEKEKVKELKNRIDKAIEYMKTLSDEYATNDYDIKCVVFNKLYYEILGDKE